MLRKNTLIIIFAAIVVLFAASTQTRLFRSIVPQDFLNDKIDRADDSEQNPNGQSDTNAEVVVVIDPGHGGSDQGTTHGEMLEKDINLDISFRLGNLLEQAGIKVVYTRESDIDVDLKERAYMANDINAALFISVHNNSMPGSPDYRGTETLYALPAQPDPGKFNGQRFAEIVQKELVDNLKTYNIGTIFRPNLAVLRLTSMPAVIAEIGYMSNKGDREKLASSEFRQKAAIAMSNAVLKSLLEMGLIEFVPN